MKELRTVNPYREAARQISGIEGDLHGGRWRKVKMCWKCQRDKYTKGGEIKLFGGGVMRFICQECKGGRMTLDASDPAGRGEGA